MPLSAKITEQLSAASGSTTALSEQGVSSGPVRTLKRPASASGSVVVPELSYKVRKEERMYFKKHDMPRRERPQDAKSSLPDRKSDLETLRMQKEAMQLAVKAAAYEVKKAQQRQKRIQQKASKLSNSELLEVYLHRQKSSGSRGRSEDTAHMSAAEEEDE